MGADIHVFVTYHDRNTNHYHWVKLFNKNGKIIPVYDARDYELFDILADNVYKDGFNSIPESCFDKDFYDEYKDSVNELGAYDFARINLADLKLWYKKHPTITNDYDEISESPLKYFIDKIEAYTDFAIEDYNIYAYNPSDIIIFYWFDR